MKPKSPKPSESASVDARSRRINKIAAELSTHQDKQRLTPKGGKRAMRMSFTRTERKRAPKVPPIIAYDFETTRINPGTPRPLYITAYSEDIAFIIDKPIQSLDHLTRVLCDEFLIHELRGCRFVAWNGNNFDVYMIAACLVDTGLYVLRPYLTKNKNLRGLRVIRKGDEELKPNQQMAWEFLDGIAMLGLAGTTLSEFLKNFAPDFQKMTGAIDFEKEDFDPSNKLHREYAFRDSEGLYHGMKRAQDIMLERFNQPLSATMGNACIKIFQRYIPEKTVIVEPTYDALSVIRSHVMRGGFCFCVGRYEGPVWKYDINQAYAAAMRDADLPCGAVYFTKGMHRHAPAYIAKVRATNPANRIPFYYKTEINGSLRSVFSTDHISDTWLTSIEIKQLQSEGWRVDIECSYFWDDCFSMCDYVNKLEHGRMNAEGGPKGAIGTMYKAVGNHSYGKTVELLEPIEIILAKDCPPGYAEYMSDTPLGFSHIWCRFTDKQPKAYHQPQIGAFITAHVRMVLRRAALLDPVAWLYGDTDCVVFSRSVSDKLDTHPSRYGAWKIEDEGTPYRIIAKKVYASFDGSTKHAKGLNIRKLNAEDFERWYNGTVPEQSQVQRNNFVKVLAGSEMYIQRSRKGTQVRTRGYVCSV